jgi:L,D-transpeptidase catalytic domain
MCVGSLIRFAESGFRLFGLGAFSLLVSDGRASAQGIATIKALKQGEFIWRPELSPAGPVVVVVSLPHQLVHVYRNGLAIGVSTCSTGAPGHTTPTGVFTILQKRQEHYSSTYNNAPMPNMQRLTWRGIALHAGHLPGYPASKGCIRLPMEFSKLVFSITGLGTSVIIADQTSAHNMVVQPGLILPGAAADDARKANTKAAQAPPRTAGKSQDSFASILVSGADRKAYLLVDGAIKFQTPIKVVDETQPLGTHLYSLIGPSPDGHSLKWNSFDIGASPESSTTVDVWSDPVLGRIEYLDGAGVKQVGETLRSGTTMVITDFAAGVESRTGPDFTVIAVDRAVQGKRVKNSG